MAREIWALARRRPDGESATTQLFSVRTDIPSSCAFAWYRINNGKLGIELRTRLTGRREE